MDELLLALILVGIVQGLLEWLPVSSEAFVLLILLFFSVPPTLALIITILLHLPTGLAALTYYRNDYYYAIRSFFKFENTWILRLLIVATIATAMVAIPLYFGLKELFSYAESLMGVGGAVVLVIIGLAMMSLGLFSKHAKERLNLKPLSIVSLKDSAIVGALQGLAIIPGISRSGVTIAGFLFLGYFDEDSLRGSFLLGGLVSIMSFLFLYVTNEIDLLIQPWAYLLISMALAYVVSLISIDYLLKIARQMDYSSFLRFIGSLMIILGLISILAYIFVYQT